MSLNKTINIVIVVVIVAQLKSLNQNRFKAHSRIYEAAAECDVVVILWVLGLYSLLDYLGVNLVTQPDLTWSWP